MFKKATIEAKENTSSGAPLLNRAASEGRTAAASKPIHTANAANVPNAEVTRDAIAKLAFQKWQKRGCPAGEDQRDWFEAERELKTPQAARAGRG